MGQRSETCQEVFHVFLTGLFHWKLDTTDTRTYSIKPEDYPRLPLFNPKSEGKCVYLNQVFWLALDNALNNLLVALVGSGLSVEDGFLTPKVVLLDSECH